MAYQALDKSDSDVGKFIKASWGDQVADNFSSHETRLDGLGVPTSAFASGWGGDGSDGDLSLSADTQVNVGPSGKQYGDIALNGWELEFVPTSGTHLVCIGISGDLTGSAGSSITVKGQGADGGTTAGENGDNAVFSIYGSTAAGGGNYGGNDGGDGGDTVARFGAQGGLGTNDDGSAGLDEALVAGWWMDPQSMCPGPGGGAGGGGSPGVGGAGGAALRIEVAGSCDGTSITIDSSGDDGGDGQGGGGGGGAGNQFLGAAVMTAAPTQVANGGAGGAGTASGDGGAGGAGRTAAIEIG